LNIISARVLMRGTIKGKIREDDTMSESPNAAVRTTTRRRVIAGVALAFGSLAAGSEVWGKTEQQGRQETANPATQARTSLHQEVDFKVSPQRIYEILLDSRQFTAFSGMPAEIDAKEGGAFSTFGGLVAGRNIELIPAQRIVQAWRPTHWEPGIYSIVKFDLKAQGAGTRIALDHTGFPPGKFDDLDPGWKVRYWDPLTKFLG
jgi:activator of HSP90 ATPase